MSAETKWPVGGYAPGHYTCKCFKCGNAFVGEKRAYQCADCVIQDLRALPAAAPVGVKPLVWHDCADGSSHDDGCQYEVARDGRYWRLLRGVTGGTSYMRHTDTLEAAKAAAQADYTARILAALAPAQPAPDAPNLCPICGSRNFTICDEQQADGTFAKGQARRCIVCKTVWNLKPQPAPDAPAKPAAIDVDAVAALVEAETERCAKVAEDRHFHWHDLGSRCLVDDDISACHDIAAAIRAKGGDA